MPLFGNRKKKESPFEDDFGEKDVPFTTNEQRMNNYGIQQIRGKSRKRRSIETGIVKVSVGAGAVLIAVSVLSGFGNSGRINAMEEHIDTITSPSFHSRYDDLGKSIITAYYSGESPPVNLMAGVNWGGELGGDDGGDVANAPAGARVDVRNLALIDVNPSAMSPIPQSELAKDVNDQFSSPEKEVLVYRGVIDNRVYTFVVNLIIPDINDSNKLPYLMAPPGMMPGPTLVSSNIEASRPDGSNSDSGFTEVELNEASISTISEWASAYAQNNNGSLKRLSGDGRDSHYYDGIGGFSLVGTPTIDWAYQFEDAEGENNLVVRVEFSMQTTVSQTRSSAENAVTGGSEGSELIQNQVMDLLLTNYQEGTPNVVAWQIGGGWDNLEAFMNAIQIPEEDGSAGIPDQEETATPSSPSDDDGDTSTSVPGAPSITPNSTSRSSSTSSETSTTSGTRTGTGTSTSRSTTTTSSN